MPTLTLNKEEANDLAKFLKENSCESYFIAKDQGAYVGACAGSKEDGTFKNILFYFKDCNPEKDEDWWENSDRKFGGDDFGEHFPAKDFIKIQDQIGGKVAFNVGRNQVKTEFIES